MAIFGWLPGADVQSIAEREVADLNSTRTGSADRRGAWNWQDSFGAWLAGTNKDEVLKLAGQIGDRRLAEVYDPQKSTQLGPLTAEYTGVQGKSEVQIKTDLANDNARATALQRTIATNPDFDPSSLAPNSQAGTILGAGARATKDANTAEARRRETKEDKRYDAEVLRADTIRKEGRLDRLNERAMQADTNRMQLQLEYARLDQAERMRAQDKKDKALMTLLQGLGNLGAAFTL